MSIVEEIRTPRDFVKDLCLRGRTATEIRAVAQNTHWRVSLAEILHFEEKRGDRWREEGLDARIEAERQARRAAREKAKHYEQIDRLAREERAKAKPKITIRIGGKPEPVEAKKKIVIKITKK